MPLASLSHLTLTIALLAVIAPAFGQAQPRPPGVLPEQNVPRESVEPRPVVPNVPAEMAAVVGQPTAIVTLEPIGENGRPTLLGAGRTPADIPNGARQVRNDVAHSWAAYSLGQQAYKVYETLDTDVPALELRHVQQLGARDEQRVWVDEWQIDENAQVANRTYSGHYAMLPWEWVVIPRRLERVRFWRIYKARVTVRPVGLPENEAEAKQELARRRKAGWVLPDGLECFVVEWCQDTGVNTGDTFGGEGRVEFVRDVRHEDVPGLHLLSESGTARLTETPDGPVVEDVRVDRRWRVERLLHLNQTGGRMLGPEEP